MKADGIEGAHEGVLKLKVLLPIYPHPQLPVPPATTKSIPLNSDGVGTCTVLDSWDMIVLKDCCCVKLSNYPSVRKHKVVFTFLPTESCSLLHTVATVGKSCFSRCISWAHRAA